jgi:MFS superfamily sulfate permease-like transporter
MFPPTRWLAGYCRQWLVADLIAGITLSAYAIPVSLAYAGLAGLPPQVGLYGYLLGGLGYAFFGSSLLYFNVESVLATVLERLRGEGPGVRLVVCDLSTSPYVDLAGARMLRDLSQELAKDGVGLRITDARSTTRDLLREEGLESTTGPIDRFTSVADVVDAFGQEPARGTP